MKRFTYILAIVLIIGMALFGCGGAPGSDTGGYTGPGTGGKDPGNQYDLSLNELTVTPPEATSGDRITFYWDVTGAYDNIYTIEFYLSQTGTIDNDSTYLFMKHCGAPNTGCFQNGYEFIDVDVDVLLDPGAYDVIALVCDTDADYNVRCIEFINEQKFVVK